MRGRDMAYECVATRWCSSEAFFSLVGKGSCDIGALGWAGSWLRDSIELAATTGEFINSFNSCSNTASSSIVNWFFPFCSIDSLMSLISSIWWRTRGKHMVTVTVKMTEEQGQREGQWEEQQLGTSLSYIPHFEILPWHHQMMRLLNHWFFEMFSILWQRFDRNLRDKIATGNIKIIIILTLR